MSQEDAEAACRAEQPVAEAQEAFDECVKKKMEQGLSKEEAEEQCKPSSEADQETEETPLSRCMKTQIELGKSEEEARRWCEDDLAGEHQEATDMLAHGDKMLKLREQQRVEQLKQQRRSPL